MRNHIHIESCPLSEICSNPYSQRALLEARALIKQLKRELGNPPNDVRLNPIIVEDEDGNDYMAIEISWDRIAREELGL